MNVAVIGTGAAAAAVVHGLDRLASGARVTLFGMDRSKPTLRASDHPRDWTHRYLVDLYGANEENAFPPLKTWFGSRMSRTAVSGKKRIFTSDTFGGLSNFWSGSMLPFTADDLSGWPLTVGDLNPHYLEIAELVGISGRRDGLNDYFSEEYANRPPIRIPPVLERLEEILNGSGQDGEHRFYAGLNRVALETREDHPRACVYCGECMTGCFKESVYSSSQSLNQFHEPQALKRFVPQKVVRVDPETRAVVVQGDGRTETHEGFDKVFLAAGCLGSSEIVMRSGNVQTGPVMTDNAVCVFPILYTGKIPPREAYLALCNLIIACVPTSGASGGHYAQAQINHTGDYLWKSVAPSWSWRVAGPAAKALVRHLFWVRLYLDGSQSNRYSLHLNDDRLECELERPADPAQGSALMKDLRKILRKSGFHIPPVSPWLQRTSSHYAGTFPYGEVNRVGEIFPGVHLCDSAAFPTCPATSPTFTIMANAHRTVSEVMNG